jgi:hypothetical protein
MISSPSPNQKPPPVETKAMDWVNARRQGRRLPQHLLPGEDIEDAIVAHNFNQEHSL